MRKRIMGLLMAMILLLSVSFGAHAQESGFLGTWYLESMEEGGEIMLAAEYGMSISITFFEGGTAEMEAFGETESFTWTLQDGAAVVEMDGETMALTLDGDQLVAAEGDGTMIFGREPVVSAEVSPVREDVTLEDFAGSWQGTHVAMSGMRMPVAEMGIELGLVVQGNTATLDVFGFEQDLACAMDGHTLVSDGFELYESDSMRFFLHEDGALSCDTGDDLVLWFERAQEGADTDTDADPGTGTGTDQSFVDTLFVCVAAEVGEMSVDVAMIGRYDVIFHADGTASFTIGGVDLQGCTWRDDGTTIILDFYTTLYEFVRVDEGLQMNYFDTMLLTYVADGEERNTPLPTPEPEIIAPVTDPVLESAEREVVEHSLFSVAYPEEWIYDEGRANLSEKSAYLKFAIFDEDEKEQYSVTISASPGSAKEHRRGFTDNGLDLGDLADGKLSSIVIDGTAFYESRPGETYRYRHDLSGVNYYVQFKPTKDVDLNAPPFSDILEGIGLHLTDEGETAVPWPWDGTPWAPDISPQMVGSFTLTPVFLKAEEPIILNRIMNTSFTVANGLIYTVTKNDLRSYRLGDEGITLENAVKLDEEFELIRTDASGKLYLSQGIWSVFVHDGFDRINAPDIKNDLVMHPSGEWGISFWVNADPKKVTVQDGIFKAEPWVLYDLTKEETRVGFFKMISDVRITDSYIIVAGKAADDSGEKIMVYDHDGNELFVLEDTREDRSGLGSITGIAETPNGFLATDGNMRDIVLWNARGAYIGKADVKKLLGANYCWLEDMHMMDDGSILIGVSQERADKSADELLFFKLTGF